MQQPIDKRIKQAQRKGIGVYVLSGFFTLAVLLGFVFWLFLIKGYSLLIGPNEALTNLKVDLDSGFAWVSNSKVYTLGGNVSIKVSALTFETTDVSIDKLSPSSIEIMLLPSPATITGRVSVATDRNDDFNNQQQYLSQSQWFLNGLLIHVGDELSYKTPPGNYQLEVHNSYFESVSQSLELSRAETVEISPALKNINGTIAINSIPQGIEIKIDGVIKGKTPFTIEAQGGQYQAILSSANYKTINDTIELQNRFLHPTRNYQLSPKLAVLDLSAKPSKGLLLINNVEHQLGRIELPANKTHKIEYKKSGHASYVNTVQLNKDKVTSLQISLEALYGHVNISTNVPALLSLDDGSKVASPVSKRLLSVQHKVEASAQGYRTSSQLFTPSPNKNTNINIRLLTEFDARRKEGLPLFVSKLGIQMKKFKPDAYTLGSPPNQTGRRRNEHQIEVDFSRPFWVSEKEITQTQFAKFLGVNKGTKSSLPVTGVSWLEAAQYTNWLSEQEGLPVFYRFQNGRYLGVNASSNGYRLPSEAEWEWLAKKSKRAVSTNFVWGNLEKLRDNIGNFADKTMNGKQLIFFDEYSDGKTSVAEVGSFNADRNGLYDLEGNVSEWVHDYYTNGLPDRSKTHTDYLGAPRGESWVIKGGNYKTGRIRELRAAYRDYSVSGRETLGFRIARYDASLE